MTPSHRLHMSFLCGGLHIANFFRPVDQVGSRPSFDDMYCVSKTRHQLRVLLPKLCQNPIRKSPRLLRLIDARVGAVSSRRRIVAPFQSPARNLMVTGRE